MKPAPEGSHRNQFWLGLNLYFNHRSLPDIESQARDFLISMSSFMLLVSTSVIFVCPGAGKKDPKDSRVIIFSNFRGSVK